MRDRFLVQIYTMQSAAEAVAVAELGVDHVGVTPPSGHGLPGEVCLEVAAEICSALVGQARSVALTVDSDLDQIEAMVRVVGPDILHLCGPLGLVGPDAVASLRLRLPDQQIMQAVAVNGLGALAVARSYEHVADYLLLDSDAPGITGIGAAGVVHDWNVSAAIVNATDLPVILAGGLSPANVAEATRAVRPQGVDSLTHTNLMLPGGGFRKNLEAVEEFVSAARGAMAT
jgi:phosphoribosylanthranilate isomerase